MNSIHSIQPNVVVAGEYGTSIQVGGPSRPEPPRPDPAADRESYEVTAARFRTREAFESAIESADFPPAIRTAGRFGLKFHFSTSEVNAWCVRVRQRAADLR